MPRGNPRPFLGHDGGVCGNHSLLEGDDVVPLALLRAPSEKLRSSGRVVAALLCRALLADTALEFTLCGSLMVMWRRRAIFRWCWYYAYQSAARLASFLVSLFGYPGATCWFVNGGGRCLVVVGRWWRYLRWGVLLTVCVFIGSL
jgi:hypothetical protein